MDSGNGCPDSDGSGTGNGSSGSCGSTPFLKAVKSDGTPVILNDVLKGSPTSFFYDRSHGLEALEAGQVGFDLYPVSLSELKQESGSISFNLKEIEPEESYIKHLSYGFCSVPSNCDLVTDQTHQNLYGRPTARPVDTDIAYVNRSSIADKKNFSAQELCRGRIVDDQDTLKSESLFLQDQDAVSFSVKRKNRTSDQTYISVGAFWRRLLSEEYYSHRVKELTETKRFNSVFVRARHYAITAFSMLALLASSMFIAKVDDDSVLSKANNTQTAHASAPRSLHVYYRNRYNQNVYFATIHPRYRLVYDTVVAIPNEAYYEDEAHIVIQATEDHYIYSLGVTDRLEDVSIGDFSPIEGLLNGTKSIQPPSEGVPLITAPGDNLAFTVPAPKSTDNISHIVFKIHGFYVPLLDLDDTKVLDWWSKLDTEERQLYVS